MTIKVLDTFLAEVVFFDELALEGQIAASSQAGILAPEDLTWIHTLIMATKMVRAGGKRSRGKRITLKDHDSHHQEALWRTREYTMQGKLGN